MYQNIKLKSITGDYSLRFTDNLSEISSLIDNNNTFTFIDENVQRLYPSLYRKNNISVHCLESNKTIEVASELLKRMVEVGVNPNSTVLAIGGGILQDLVGFCCSIYNRGVSYILIPTTLLGQADSCIGGKTSINFHKKKNILGTFFPPTEIIIHTGFLNTLTELEYLSGMGEIYKFHILQNNMGEFSKALDKSNITKTVYNSLLFKKSIIDIDEFDKGQRKLLNFGHTFGHALEFTSNYEIPHGIAVIIGSLISCRISSNMGYIVPDLELVGSYANKLLSNIYIDERWFCSHSIIEASKMDKKNIDDNIVDVLLNKTPFTSKIDVDVIDVALSETLKMIKQTK
jgi:3-dehydroquinate synthase